MSSGKWIDDGTRVNAREISRACDKALQRRGLRAGESMRTIMRAQIDEAQAQKGKL